MAPAELRVGRRNVRVTHPDKLLFPGAKLTKLDLAHHYERVAPVIVGEPPGNSSGLETSISTLPSSSAEAEPTASRAPAPAVQLKASR